MKEDTLKVNVMNKLSYLFTSKNDNLQLKYAKDALTLSKKIAFKKGIFFSNSNLATYYIDKFDYTKGFETCNLLLKTATTKNEFYKVYKNFYLYIYTKVIIKKHLSMPINCY